MKVGLFVTNQQTLDTDMVRALDEQIAMVRAARDAGWNSLLSGQHYLNEGNNKQLQTVPFLARLAAEAGDMTIGLGILLLNLHNPVYTAETVASLDIIAHGNFIFGVGLGYRDVEFDAFGVPKGERVKRFEEYLALIERLWTEDSVSYDGPGCRLANVRMNIRPVQKPRPPIWMAANNDPAVRRAARLGDAWLINPHSTIDTIRRQLALYRLSLKRSARAQRGSCRLSRRSIVPRTGRAHWRWPAPICLPSTEIMPSGGRTRSCRTTRTSPARSTT